MSTRHPAAPSDPARAADGGTASGSTAASGPAAGPARAVPAAPPRPDHPPRTAASAAPGPGRHTPGSGLGWLPFRPTIRIRLTLLYGGMFLMAGVLLVLVIYMLARQALQVGAQLPMTTIPENTRVIDPRTNQVWTPQQFQEQIELWQAQAQHAALDALLRRSITVLVGLAVAAFALGYAVAGRVLSPLGRITRTAREVAGSDLHRRIELDGPDDELKELADTFDEMLDRLDRSFDSQRKFVANASHELRTPLAINRTLLEVQLSDPEASPELQQLGRTLLATNERSEQLVEGLLLLARSDNEITDRRPVEFAEVASQALEQTRAEAESRRVALRTSLAPATVSGNGVLLERIALNLVQNAVRYNTPDGWVQVSTAAVPGGGELVVSNTGPVIPGYEMEHIFEPFRRVKSAERTRSDKGVGLGLSIVRSVVRAHGGSIEAVPRPGGGLDVRVYIPGA
ncbi:HAMP domain-containing histidine kinase [Streptacidiphilus sp. ASG 303]|uniref:sensor histidine kinase n=1 Tax=Streptacidiphilus sp. ASG 303 TaxID=2896847 RepID=UPI001E58F37A|nr:HAMP domain-containing sensor histidine kinase [Streptacidiphilus sp. ASG 303]MCD0486116.1 HAMP domain-containing histidine kinase [Streptacidiphilus sp. ASG 303]